MKIYTWTYPETERLGEPEYCNALLEKLLRLGATGLYLMVDEAATLSQPQPVAEFVQQCSEAGLDCHLGLIPFSVPADATPEMLRRRYAYTQDGQLKTRNLCPAWVENRLLALQRATRLLDLINPPALHLDYLRYFFVNNPIFGYDLEWEDGRRWVDTYFRCECPLCQTERLELLGREATPYDWQHPGFIFKRLQRRVENVDEVTRGFRKLCDDRGLKLSVAVRVQYFNRAIIEGQDWVRWCRDGLLDMVSPMNYATDLPTVERRFRDNQRLLQHAPAEVLEGLALKSSAGESIAETLRAQMERVVELGAEGVAIFHLGTLSDGDVDVIRASA